MKKTDLDTYICPLIFVVAFITSCSGQEKLNLSKDNQVTYKPHYIPYTRSDSQIAEYVRNIFQDKMEIFGLVLKVVVYIATMENPLPITVKSKV